MQPLSILETVSQFVADTFLDGESDDLDATSPLLEWGILDSMGMVRLVAFIEERFEVRIGEDAITPQNFRNLRSISSLVEAYSLKPQAPASAEDGEVEPELRDLLDYGATRERVRLDSGASVHGVRMHGPGPTWVLLPEPGQPSWYFAFLQRTLESFHESLALDLAGSGASHCANPEPTFWDQLALVSEALDKLESDPVVLVAHGPSVLIATEIARRHPERVRALVVVSFGALEQPGSVLAGQPELAQAPGARAFFDRDAADLARELFAGLHVPTLLVCGQDDPLVSAAALERACEQLPSAVVKWLARTGHALPRERPDELSSMIETFLKTLS